MSGSKNKYRFFGRFFFTYIAVFFISLISTTLLLFHSSEIIERKLMQGHLAMLEQTRYVMDGRMNEINNMMRVFMLNEKVKRFIHIPDPFYGTNIIRILEAKASLVNYKIYNEMVIDYFFAFKNSEFILGPSIVYRLPKFYDAYFVSRGQTLEDWKTELFGTVTTGRAIPGRDVTINNSVYSIIQYVVSFPIANDNRAAAVCLVDNEAVRSLLSAIDVTHGGGVFVLSAQGEIISHIGDDAYAPAIERLSGAVGMEQLNSGDKMLMTHTTSQANGWKYVSVISSKAALEELDQFRLFIISITAAVIFITILCSYYFARRNTKPIEGIYDKNLMLEDAMKRQLPVLQISLVEKLLRGEFYKDDELYEHFELIRLDFSGRLYAIALIQLAAPAAAESMTQLAEIRVVIDCSVPDDAKGTVYVHNLSENKIALIFIYKNESEAGFKEYIINFLKELNSLAGHTSWHIGVGGIYRKMTDISKSYYEAEQTINYHIIFEKHERVFWYANLPESPVKYYYPADTELRLCSMVKNGDKAGVRALIGALYDENIVKRRLSPAMLNLFIENLWINILKLTEQNLVQSVELRDVINSHLERLGQMDTLEKLRLCTQVYYDICDAAAAYKPDAAERLLGFIDENYANANMSLSFVSEEFKMSEAYLSQYFKEHTNENFHVYLQYVRIKKAVELLESTEIPVTEIYALTGYGSYNSFARAFKRFMGMNATDYRKLNRKE